VATELPVLTWNDIPPDVQDRIRSQGVDGVSELASWAYENRPCWLQNDDLHDLLCALIVFLLRSDTQSGMGVQSLPAILTSIAYRQKCQRFRDKEYSRRERFAARSFEESATPFTQIEKIELRASVRDALKVLNRVEREALLRKHVLDETYREISLAIYGVAGRKAEGRVSVMLSRARRKLKNNLRA
jgi:DNA-directed RNA polymerase specialized sigma24 family protein